MLYLEFIGTNGKYLHKQCGDINAKLEQDNKLLVIECGLFSEYKQYNYAKVIDDFNNATIYKINNIVHTNEQIIMEIDELSYFQTECLKEFFEEA